MSGSSDSAGPWTVARLLAWTREYLQARGVESPRLCAEILLAHAMDCERIQLFTRHDSIPDEKTLAPFRALVKEAAAGKPIAYLTGQKEFFSLPFSVTPEVLIPRPETEILVERTLDIVRKQWGDDAATSPSILDLGTGSGCIAISLARHLARARLFASDTSEAALVVARQNAKRHGVADRIEFRAGDLFGAWSDDTGATSFDVIVSNPPYIAEGSPDVAENVRAYEPHEALFAGPDGLAVARRLIDEAPRHLAAGGHLFVELAFDQAARVRDLLGTGDWQDVVAYRDGGGHERVIHARRAAAGSAQVA